MSRIDRIESILKKEIAEILHRRIADERIGFVSILRIKLSKDLHHGHVYYSQLGSEKDIERTRKGLASAAPFIHSELCKVLHLQTIPRLKFHYDSGIEKASKTIEKLNTIQESSL